MEKQKKLKKQILILSIIPIVSALMILLLYVLIPDSDSIALGLILVVLLILIAVSIILIPVKIVEYLISRRRNTDFGEFEGGIDLAAKPDLEASGIYCGDTALFTTRERLLIPYEDFAWTYYMETNLYFIFKVKRAVISFKNGKAVKIKCTQEEFMYFMNNYVIPRDPKVLVGYNLENIKEYRRRYKEWKKQRK